VEEFEMERAPRHWGQGWEELEQKLNRWEFEGGR